MADVIQFCCKIDYLFKNCPKSDGWFGCYATIIDDDIDMALDDINVKLKGVTKIPLKKDMELLVTVQPDYSDDDIYTSYKILSFEVCCQSIKGIIAYMSSFTSLSRIALSKIVNKLGINAIDIISDDSSVIRDIITISDEQYNKFVDDFNRAELKNRLGKLLSLSSKKINNIIAANNDGVLFDKGKENNATVLINAIKENPYCLTRVHGIGFKTADEIAIKLYDDNILTSDFRIEAGIDNCLQTNGFNKNSLYVNVSDTDELYQLCYSVEKLLNIKFSGGISELGNRIIKYANKSKNLVLDKSTGQYHLYSAKIYEAMQYFSGFIVQKTLHATEPCDLISDLPFYNDICYYENSYGNIRLTDEQRIAVNMALSNKLSIITGGPGRGKTRIIDAVAYIYNDLYDDYENSNSVVLLAPTGKAKSKLNNDTNNAYKSTTWTVDYAICKAMVDNKFINKWNKNDVLIIIDESSMIDLMKIVRLIKMFPKCRYCFVGDEDQLPPIDKGHMFSDMMKTGLVPISRLTTPMRNGGLILSNSDKIKNGDMNLEYDDESMILYNTDKVIDIVLNKYVQHVNQDGFDQTVVLCPIKKTDVGVVNLNLKIQNIMCPENKNAQIKYDRRRARDMYVDFGTPIKNVFYGDSNAYTCFRVGDIVVNTNNMNQKSSYKYDNDDYFNGDAIDRYVGVFNGDCGQIIAYIPECYDENDNMHSYVIVKFFDGRISEFDLKNNEFDFFDLGYVLTVHKSQGCEYNNVIYVSPVSMASFGVGFANRNLVYTAVTRAKKSVEIIGSIDAFNRCIKYKAPECKSDVVFWAQYYRQGYFGI